MQFHGLRSQARRTAGLLAALAFVAGGTARADVKGNQKCRRSVNSQLGQVVQQGLKSQEKCYLLAGKACVPSDVCAETNSFVFDIIDGGKYTAKKSQVSEKLQGASNPLCPDTDAVETLANYAGGDIGVSTYGDIDNLIAFSAEASLGAADLDCDKPKTLCQKEVAKWRTKITSTVLGEAAKCQTNADKTATLADFGALKQPDCLIDGSNSKVAGIVSTALSKIGTKCTGLTAADLGTCSPFPGCVVDAAIAAGQNLSLAAYPPTDCSPTIAGTRTVTVTINTPVALGGVTVEVGYPRFQSGIAGNGDVSGSITDLTSGSFLSGFDTDHSVKVTMAGATYNDGDALFSIAFDKCQDLAKSTCSITTTTDCEKTSDCPTGETCIPRTNVCNVSQRLACGEPTDPACPPGEVCTTQASLTTCTVIDAVNEFAAAVDGVTCSVNVTEP